MIESETVNALLEVVENLEAAHVRLSAYIDGLIRPENNDANLGIVRVLVADSAGLVQSILSRGR